MTDRIFENNTMLEVSDKNDSIEFDVFEGGIAITGENGYENRTLNFLSAQEATRLKEFLIKNGF